VVRAAVARWYKDHGKKKKAVEHEREPAEVAE
jgi:hypothetical protein